MDFELTKKQEMFRTLFQEFAEKEVAPKAFEIDENGEFPWDTVKKMGKLGFLGLPFTKEYGGAGADTLTYIMAVEEISRACAATGVILSAHVSLGCHPIYQFGTPQQKEKYLVPMAKGELLGAFGLTEPNAGTDAAGQQTAAVLDGDAYILNGTKIFITNGGCADVYIVFAMTDPAKGLKGISAFIVEKGTPGFTFGPKEHKMGIRASSTTELIFQDCRIPKENLLGKEGDGFKIAMQTLDGGRIGIAAQALGIAQAALDECVRYTKERQQFNKPLSNFQAIQWMIADMATDIDAARFLVYRAAVLKDKKKPFSKEAAMAKLFASEAAMKHTVKAVQIHGGYGYMKEYKVERLMRDAKITEIYEGTSEVQRMVIAGNTLK
ncbi:MAG: acyl-CoA dehydrogenase domain protein [Peptococcaceae bacterium]|jgi:butyryl-CoA dehydrogenase|uniref:Acyl-CoA dehydrogenase n=1 Tax=Thermanaerosceptrum fracticalcis TaxID=1712410 RepID=A0A7G6DZI5_THEFR|nr:acyl-CoA dehydrogenase [Thermanaerosceptrum fracticalcis]MBZ4653367.1 acyl-CoA dehydrogenase domain protein [Peptococcaceae bacterium]QNB45239.1 acyl-CoA dehydrogenase [Thermanaerosceptrum fracticalcis]